MMRSVIRVAAILLTVTFVAGCWLFSGGRDSVDWHRARAVVLESDDWGLAGFVPDEAAREGLELEELQAGHFPPVYWSSTLEDSTDVARLASVLQACRGRDGLPAVFQPNYIVSAMQWTPSEDEAGTWTVHDLPGLPPRWHRRGLWTAVGEAIRDGVWCPELHGRYHYDPLLRKQSALSTDAARRATERGILLFPGSSDAFELGPWRDDPLFAAELDRAMEIFEGLFGRAPESIIAPDYLWVSGHEDLWQSRGLLTIQAKREQRYLAGSSLLVRAQKYIDRALARRIHPRRRYLERNCRLETAQADDWSEVVESCSREVEEAWKSGAPAIIETHRINFVSLEPEMEEEGRGALEELLTRISTVSAGPETGPLFLSDSEVARLAAQGVSYRRYGEEMVLRNLTHSWRHVYLADPGPGRNLRACLLPPNSTRRVHLQ